MADNQDPLAALQKLLEDQKSATGQSDSIDSNNHQSTSEGENNISPPPVENPGPSAEEIALLQKQKEEEDNLKIQEQLKVMNQELKATPQYQARLSQKQASEAELDKKRLEERSKRIFQLKHLEND